MTSLADRRPHVPPGPLHRAAARALLGGLVMAWVIAGPALAHADLVTADPADGTVLPLGPLTVTLTFSEALDPAKSSFTLVAQSGTVGTGRATGDGTVMTLGPLVQDGRRLGAGAYEIRWTSVALDGDVLRGKLTFTVLEPTVPPATPTPAPTPTAGDATSPAPASVAPTSSETINPEPAPSAAPTGSSASAGDVVLPIAVVLLAIVAVGVLLLRRSRGA